MSLCGMLGKSFKLYSCNNSIFLNHSKFIIYYFLIYNSFKYTINYTYSIIYNNKIIDTIERIFYHTITLRNKNKIKQKKLFYYISFNINIIFNKLQEILLLFQE
ncbi:hypothetical protein PFMALIP_01613 [Plasmodium falciparum MaliPS096_E11]|uniref:Uncharacterized protein n=1 Tax=Plasmodium falciparum MaliPS096_E11 TaxID=1036727 RepID=A0A024WSZ5_PLAFA|nr:hypothetical protein PFMALIP_01613 [Plasmodium falciparum MaliPS096_E11]